MSEDISSSSSASSSSTSSTSGGQKKRHNTNCTAGDGETLDSGDVNLPSTDERSCKRLRWSGHNNNSIGDVSPLDTGCDAAGGILNGADASIAELENQTSSSSTASVVGSTELGISASSVIYTHKSNVEEIVSSEMSNQIKDSVKKIETASDNMNATTGSEKKNFNIDKIAASSGSKIEETNADTSYQLPSPIRLRPYRGSAPVLLDMSNQVENSNEMGAVGGSPLKDVNVNVNETIQDMPYQRPSSIRLRRYCGSAPVLSDISEISHKVKKCGEETTAVSSEISADGGSKPRDINVGNNVAASSKLPRTIQNALNGYQSSIGLSRYCGSAPVLSDISEISHKVKKCGEETTAVSSEISADGGSKPRDINVDNVAAFSKIPRNIQNTLNGHQSSIGISRYCGSAPVLSDISESSNQVEKSDEQTITASFAIGGADGSKLNDANVNDNVAGSSKIPSTIQSTQSVNQSFAGLHRNCGLASALSDISQISNQVEKSGKETITASSSKMVAAGGSNLKNANEKNNVAASSKVPGTIQNTQNVRPHRYSGSAPILSDKSEISNQLENSGGETITSSFEISGVGGSEQIHGNVDNNVASSSNILGTTRNTLTDRQSSIRARRYRGSSPVFLDISDNSAESGTVDGLQPINIGDQRPSAIRLRRYRSSGPIMSDTSERSNQIENSVLDSLSDLVADVDLQLLRANLEYEETLATQRIIDQTIQTSRNARQFLAQLRRYRSSTPLPDVNPSSHGALNDVSNIVPRNSAHVSDDSSDVDPFIFPYDTQSSENSDDMPSLASQDPCDSSSDEEEVNEPVEVVIDEDENNAEGDDDVSRGVRRKSHVLGLVDKVLSKNLSTCQWNMTRAIMWRESGMANRFGSVGGAGAGSSAGMLGHNRFNSCFYASQYVVERMELSHCLRGHNGCVNSLNFNRSGNLLCSGSDDKRIWVWDWACDKSKHSFKSGHRENIFQTKFISASTDLDIVSAGRDGQVRRTIVSSSGETTKSCLYKHKNAVHKLVMCPDSQFEILSVGEDGYIRHCDLRQKTGSMSLLKVYKNGESGKKVRLFSIAHHPYAHEVCVCGSDRNVRVFDKRKFNEPVHKMCPSHLTSTPSQVTCCTYNHNGSEILATYSDEQIYLFDNNKYTAGNFLHVYRGHCNHRTIKGVNFFGPNSEYVISGSDCGNVFFWDKSTEAIVNFMSADVLGVVNCLEPHPSIPVLATSGLDYSVKVWSPGSERTSPDKEKVRSCIMRNMWRSDIEGPDLLDNALNNIIIEAFHPPVFDSDDSLSLSSLIRYGEDSNILTTSSSSSSSTSTNSDSTNGTQSTENNDHQYFVQDSDDSSGNDRNILTGLNCRTQ